MTATPASLTIRKTTLRELFRYTDWARDQVYTSADGLSDAQLDRPFEMGAGTLRETLSHLGAAERVWLDRWKHAAQPRYRASAAGIPLSALRNDACSTAAERDAYFAPLTDADLARPVGYTNLKGQPFTFPLGLLMLHVANHGQHHRAQILNMLRHVGATLPKPGPDYIFMKLSEPGGGTNSATPPELDADTLRAHAAYGQWAQRRVLDAAAALTDRQLDQAFEMGCGTLRETLAHIRFAEEWWLRNWTRGPEETFPETPPTVSIAELRQLTEATFAARTEYLARLVDADLHRFVKAQPRPGIYREFTLGVSALQASFHGVHHRAQAVNMLRRVGAQPPALDLIRMFD